LNFVFHSIRIDAPSTGFVAVLAGKGGAMQRASCAVTHNKVKTFFAVVAVNFMNTGA